MSPGITYRLSARIDERDAKESRVARPTLSEGESEIIREAFITSRRKRRVPATLHACRRHRLRPRPAFGPEYLRSASGFCRNGRVKRSTRDIEEFAELFLLT